MAERFDSPKRVAINRVYTGKGDGGATSLVGGQLVPKTDPRIAAYGAVDELNAALGNAVVEAQDSALYEELNDALPDVFLGEGVEQDDEEPADVDAVDELHVLVSHLVRVQHQLFNLGSILATLPEDVHPKQPRIRAEDARWLEEEMDRCNALLPALRSFVLPGGCRLATELHVCRTVARRVEREVCALAEHGDVDQDVLVYLNRLSDAFFVWSRWANLLVGADETLWEPNAASGG